MRYLPNGLITDWSRIPERSVLELWVRETQFALKSGYYLSHPENLRVGVLAFLEPSTRTRVSFELAALRLGCRSIFFAGDSSSSVKKGESLADSLRTLFAMKPDFMVVRSDTDQDVLTAISESDCPVINAGWGRNSHPTQAVLDLVTLLDGKELGDQTPLRLVQLGDWQHSRVAHSHYHLWRELGWPIALCGPDDLELRTAFFADAQYFGSREEALAWADVVHVIRWQDERHTSSEQEFGEARWCLDRNALALLNKPQTKILVAGPFQREREISSEVLVDPRCLVWNQVGVGVAVRATLIRGVLEGWL